MFGAGVRLSGWATLPRGGVRDVTVKLYPQARHEIFNETNRDQITADVIDWLVAHLEGRPPRDT